MKSTKKRLTGTRKRRYDVRKLGRKREILKSITQFLVQIAKGEGLHETTIEGSTHPLAGSPTAFREHTKTILAH